MDFIFDPSLVLYLPLYQMEGASFMSKDAYGHLCTVTGALWRPNGRWFDKIDDIITVPAVTSLANLFDGGGTIDIIFKIASVGESNAGYLWAKNTNTHYLHFRDEAAGNVKLQFNQMFTGISGWRSSAADISLNVTHHLSIEYNNSLPTNDPNILLDGEAYAVTQVATGTGTRADDSAGVLVLGNSPAKTNTTDGTISEMIWWNRSLTLSERLNIYLATKWRYR